MYVEIVFSSRKTILAIMQGLPVPYWASETLLVKFNLWAFSVISMTLYSKKLVLSRPLGPN